MGNVCFTGNNHRHDSAVVISEPLDEGLGHSFCYVRPEHNNTSLQQTSSTCSNNNNTIHSEDTTMFRSISGASVSANTSTPLSTSFVDMYSSTCFDRAATFESSQCFASIPLQPVPRGYYGVGGGGGNSVSGPMAVSGGGGFLSGSIERGFLSGPLERASVYETENFKRSFSHSGFKVRKRSLGLIGVVKSAISRTINRGQSSLVAPIKGVIEMVVEKDKEKDKDKDKDRDSFVGIESSYEFSLDDDHENDVSRNLQWAQGKAGEDRVHVVISEELGWVFVGIYDGFNGPDAPDYLLSNLYNNVHEELKGLLWEDHYKSGGIMRSPDSCLEKDDSESATSEKIDEDKKDWSLKGLKGLKKNRSRKRRLRGAAKKWEESQKRWKTKWDRERIELETKIKELDHNSKSGGLALSHNEVLKVLSKALRKTEESYLDVADKMVTENPELALMGSCVLVMLMKGEDVYVMNVGDSRVVLGQTAEPELWLGNHDLEMINEETSNDLEKCDTDDESDGIPDLNALQLTFDHSTCVDEEVQRIKNEHRDDPNAIMNDRVKGSLKVTRAFGAGFLKQPKWNNALLEMFQIDYVGTSPYISCIPSVHHHRLGSKDRFLILSSDGLYQYFTNEEAVTEVEMFISTSPEGDPAQHLVEEVLFRAAKKAGMEFHELLEIPQGDRRRYHDDVSIIVISLEGRIWRSCV